MASNNVNINPSFVREIIETSLDDATIEGAIATADVLIRDRLTGLSIATDVSTEIKRWLSAHFVALQDATTRVSEEKLGEATIKYAKIVADDSSGGIASTRWGRVALALDHTGTLAGAGGRRLRLVAL